MCPYVLRVTIPPTVIPRFNNGSCPPIELEELYQYEEAL